MKRWLNRALRSARNYSLVDFGFLKPHAYLTRYPCGAYWSEYFLRHTVFLWCVFWLLSLHFVFELVSVVINLKPGNVTLKSPGDSFCSIGPCGHAT